MYTNKLTRHKGYLFFTLIILSVFVTWNYRSIQAQSLSPAQLVKQESPQASNQATHLTSMIQTKLIQVFLQKAFEHLSPKLWQNKKQALPTPKIPQPTSSKSNLTSTKIKIGQHVYQSYQCGLAEMIYNPKVQQSVLEALSLDFSLSPSKLPNPLSPWRALIAPHRLQADVSKQKAPGRFLHLSQAMLNWLTTIQITPQTKVYGYTLQQLYDTLFKDSIHAFAVAYLYLSHTKRMDLESQVYLQAMMYDSYFHGPSYLQARFEGLSLLNTVRSNHSCQTLSRSLGFWLRRHLDGSDQALWKVLSQIIQQFDPHWIAHTLKKIDGIHQKSPRLGMQLSSLQKEKIITKFLPQLPIYQSKVDKNMSTLSIAHRTITSYQLSPRDLLFNTKILPIIATEMGLYHKLPVSHLIEKVSGVPFEKPYQSHEIKRPFVFVNPLFIQWVSDQLNVNPQQTIHGYTLQTIYQTLFRPMVSTLVYSYLYLNYGQSMQQHQAQYSFAMLDKNFNAIIYLQQKYKTLEQIYSTQNQPYFPMYQAVGFWLRRGMDGSASIIWASMRSLIERFDSELSKVIQQKENYSK